MVSGRRDFGEFGAKLEKHLERLPDYAQRAQEKLQQYFPPDAGGQRANPLRRPAPARPTAITDVPVIAEARSRWARWNAPAAKLERRKRRASRALTLWIILTLLCGLYAVATGLGLIGAGGLTEAFGGIAGAIVFGTLGVRTGLRLRQLHRTELPVSTTPPPLPSPRSAAREPMERLAESEASLAELLRQLSAPASMVSDESVEEARATAAEAASALRGLAGRIQAIERARNSAPAGDRKALDTAIRTLREQLDDGLEGYGALVAAAGHAVAAGGSGLRQSKDALTDATDRLAGLAIALREIS
ncbi:hypothetical protein [Amycolatopsis sp. GM8]|uniref:phage shock envelope stress response protein PspM n=1 Tax=Amycolatopsis sp. GM8 TaxID=2896530 RepID=UPI001F213283|nr:hypothetical protein [Amycolatopsis sp. GM8]